MVTRPLAGEMPDQDSLSLQRLKQNAGGFSGGFCPKKIRRRGANRESKPF
jgi:hypothetical protein